MKPWQPNDFRIGFEIEVFLTELTPIAGLNDVFDETPPRVCANFARALKEITGLPFVHARKTGGKPRFAVVSEYDLDPVFFPDWAVGGVEIITPPLPMSEAETTRMLIVSALEQLCPELAESVEFGETNAQLGWHINIDSPRFQTHPEPVALGVPEHILLRDHDRTGSKLLAPLRHGYGGALLRTLRAGPSGDIVGDQVDEVISRHLHQWKSFATNASRLTYTELRHFGTAAFLDLDHSIEELIFPFLLAWTQTTVAEEAKAKQVLDTFRILADWYSHIEDRITYTLSDKPSYPRWRSLEVQMDGARLGNAFCTGSADVHIETDGDDYWSATHQALTDWKEAFAIIALDAVEYGHHRRYDVQFSNASFATAVADLHHRLQSRGLLNQSFDRIPCSDEAWAETLGVTPPVDGNWKDAALAQCLIDRGKADDERMRLSDEFDKHRSETQSDPEAAYRLCRSNFSLHRM